MKRFLDFIRNVKPVYLYVGSFVIIIIALFIFANVRNEKHAVKNPERMDVSDEPIPNDPIHNALKNPIAEKPDKSNVMPDIMQHMKDLKQAVAAHPSDTLKLREYADFLAQAQMNDKAINYYQKVLRINPRRVDIMTSMVYIFYSEHNLKQAENYLNKILAVNRNDVDAMYNLGAVWANEGNRDKAKQLWTKIVRDYPNSPLAQKAKASLDQL